MKNSLSKRLFLITLGLLLGLMGLTLIFQTFIFENFYEQKKTTKLANELNRFSIFYSYQLNTNESITNAFKHFEDNNSAKIAIITKSGKIKYISKRTENDPEELEVLTYFASEILKDSNTFSSISSSKNPYTTTFTCPNIPGKRIGVARSMSVNSENDSIVITVSSVQAILEAGSVINELYSYIFVGAIFISIILSLIYSNLISKPLVSINRVAKKMSKMDFNEKCYVNRSDEIGNLANTLNFLSYNLQSALEDLKSKNKKLEEDIEKERKLDLMRKDFIASVSHELKTPIGIIEGYAEGLKDGIVAGEDAKAYLETIIDESHKMNYLVTNMLELSKLESGNTKAEPIDFNINRLIKNVISKHTLSASEGDLEIIFTPQNEYSYIYADCFQMEQILTNLITNCIKYTPPHNKIKIEVLEEDTTYRVNVINTGTHIPDEEFEHLFTKFYRIDKSRSRKSNSSGLGLSIVKNLLELNNCKFSFENIDVGVLFTFTATKSNLDDSED